MICSMTGFGSVQHETEIGSFSIEIKTVNNRFLDMNFRLPSGCLSLEPEIRKIVMKTIRRGRADITVRWERSGEAQPVLVPNVTAIRNLIEALRPLQEDGPGSMPVRPSDLLQLPGILTETYPEVSEKKLHAALIGGIRKALRVLARTRRVEGAVMALEVMNHLEELENRHAEILTRKDLVLEAYRDRLHKKISEFVESGGEKVDRERLDAEVLLYADKSDITEELSRLNAHFQAFHELIQEPSEEPVGRPLDFLCQEMNREINTIGSKSRDSELTAHVLTMKNTLEKIREQVHNNE